MYSLFALGSNGSGQLGIGHEDDTSVPQRCVFEYSEKGGDSNSLTDRVAKIVAGGNHTLLLFESGVVFAVGSNEHGQCGLPRDVKQTNVFKRVRLQCEDSTTRQSQGGDTGVAWAKFMDISATWEASFFVVAGDHDEIYACGRGTKGELGLGKDVTEQFDATGLDTAFPLEHEAKIRSIHSSMAHTVVLTETGEVLGWGAGRKGQVGDQGKADKFVWQPIKIMDIPELAEKIVVGREFTFAVGKRNRWHVLLGDSKFETYLPDLKALIVSPHEIDYQLMASWSNIYILSLDATVQGWGRNDHGQLPPRELPRLQVIAAGSEHCVGLTSDGQVIAWGWGEHGNCGVEVDARASVAQRWNVLPMELAKDGEIVAVGAGCATSFIVISEVRDIS